MRLHVSAKINHYKVNPKCSEHNALKYPAFKQPQVLQRVNVLKPSGNFTYRQV
jgi:hypothetical protein